ncbi:MAG: hypothetical protein U0271_13380 [Polyangiaceae bacterium]
MQFGSRLVGSTLAALLFATTVGCKKPYVGAHARVKRDVVVVSLHLTPGQKARVGKQEKTTEDSREVFFYFAIDKFKPGRNELAVALTDKGKTSEEKVAFMVPNGGGEPFLQLHACVATKPDMPATMVRGGFGRVDNCIADDKDLNYTLVATANPGATVSVAGKKVEADDDGNLELRVAALSGLLNTPVGAAWDADGPPAVPIPVEIQSGKSSLKGDILVTADTGRLVGGLLRGFKPGKPLVEGLASDGPGLAVYQEEREFASPHFIGGPAPLRQLRVVALGKRAAAGRPNGACGPYESMDNKGVGMTSLKRFDYDVEVAAYDARTGGLLAQQTISAATEDCPLVVNSRESEVAVSPSGAIDAWIRTVIPGEKAAP